MPDLTDYDRRVRLGSFFDPYHECIAALRAGFRARGTVPLIVAVHSFSPVLAGATRPWHAGVLWDHDEPNARRLLAGLRAQPDLVVGDNEPYSGRHPANYTIDHHAKAQRLAAPLHRGPAGPARIARRRRALGAAAGAHHSRNPGRARVARAAATGGRPWLITRRR